MCHKYHRAAWIPLAVPRMLRISSERRGRVRTRVYSPRHTFPSVPFPTIISVVICISPTSLLLKWKGCWSLEQRRFFFSLTPLFRSILFTGSVCVSNAFCCFPFSGSNTVTWPYHLVPLSEVGAGIKILKWSTYQDDDHSWDIKGLNQ